MGNVVRESRQPLQRFWPIEIGDNGNGAKDAQRLELFYRPGNRINAPSPPKPLHESLTDVATSDNEQSSHVCILGELCAGKRGREQ